MNLHERLCAPQAEHVVGQPRTVIEAAIRNGELRHVFVGRRRAPRTTLGWLHEWQQGRTE